MTIKRLSKKKTSKIKKENESLTDSFINGGGKTTEESTKTLEEEIDYRFTLRVPKIIIHRIDEERKKHVVKLSRNNWILQALEEKLKSKRH